MAGSHTVEFTDANFEQEVIKSDRPVLVDFWAEWCAPCRMLSPVIDELARDYTGKVKVGKVNTDSATGISVKYSISAIPTVIVFNGGQIVEKFQGVRAKRDFQTALDKLVAAK